MKKVTKQEFIQALKSGDIGINASRNLFAKLQNWYRKRFKEGPGKASHGFFIINPPEISEANGLYVSRSQIGKFIGNSTKVWVFRYANLTEDDQEDMKIFADAAERTKGHYSVGGIWQFFLRFVGVKKKVKDQGGVFCTEYTSWIIKAANLPYMSKNPWEITPSLQLNWMLDAKASGWHLAAQYDGKDYLINDEIP